MTFKEFKKMTAGVDEYQVFHQGTNKWYYGEETEKRKNGIIALSKHFVSTLQDLMTKSFVLLM